MKRTLSITLIVLLLSFSAACAKQVMVQAPIPELTKSIESISASNMTPEQKAAAIKAVTEAVTELQNDKSNQQFRESIAQKIFDLSIKLITLGASIFATVRVTT